MKQVAERQTERATTTPRRTRPTANRGSPPTCVGGRGRDRPAELVLERVDFVTTCASCRAILRFDPQLDYPDIRTTDTKCWADGGSIIAGAGMVQIDDWPDDPPLKAGEHQPARWITTESLLSVEEVRTNLEDVFGAQPSESAQAIMWTRVKNGFVLRWRSGSRDLAAEVVISGWESGTQIQLIIPSGLEHTKEDVSIPAEMLRAAAKGR